MSAGMNDTTKRFSQKRSYRKNQSEIGSAGRKRKNIKNINFYVASLYSSVLSNPVLNLFLFFFSM